MEPQPVEIVGWGPDVVIAIDEAQELAYVAVDLARLAIYALVLGLVLVVALLALGSVAGSTRR